YPQGTRFLPRFLKPRTRRRPPRYARPPTLQQSARHPIDSSSDCLELCPLPRSAFSHPKRSTTTSCRPKSCLDRTLVGRSHILHTQRNLPVRTRRFARRSSKQPLALGGACIPVATRRQPTRSHWRPLR